MARPSFSMPDPLHEELARRQTSGKSRYVREAILLRFALEDDNWDTDVDEVIANARDEYSHLLKEDVPAD